MSGLIAQLRKGGGVTVVNVAVMAVSFVAQMALAYSWGLSDKADNYYLLLTISMVTGGLVGSLIQNAIVPRLVRSMQSSSSSILNVLRTAGLLVALLTGAVVGIVCMLCLVGFREEVFGISVVLALVLALCTALLQVMSAVANADNRYFAPAFVLCIPPLSLLAVFLALGSSVTVEMAIGVQVVGVIMSIWIVYRPMRRGGFFLAFNGVVGAAKILMISMVPLALGSVAYNIIPLVERSLAEALGSGAVTVVALASRVGNAVGPLLLNGLTLLLFTDFSRLGAESAWEMKGRLAYVHRRFVMVVLVLVPVVVASFVFTEQIVDLLFMRGNFNSQDAARVALCVPWYVLAYACGGLAGVVTKATLGFFGAAWRLSLLTIVAVTIALIIMPTLTHQLGELGIALSVALLWVLVVLFALLNFEWMARCAIIQEKNLARSMNR